MCLSIDSDQGGLLRLAFFMYFAFCLWLDLFNLSCFRVSFVKLVQVASLVCSLVGCVVCILLCWLCSCVSCFLGCWPCGLGFYIGCFLICWQFGCVAVQWFSSMYVGLIAVWLIFFDVAVFVAFVFVVLGMWLSSLCCCVLVMQLINK